MTYQKKGPHQVNDGGPHKTPAVGRVCDYKHSPSVIAIKKLSDSLKEFERANTEVIAGRIFAVKRGGLTDVK